MRLDLSLFSFPSMHTLFLSSSSIALLLAALAWYLTSAPPTPRNPPPPKMARNELGVLASRAEWQAALGELPDLTATKGRIPSFFFSHGHPALLWPEDVPNPRAAHLVSLAPRQSTCYHGTDASPLHPLQFGEISRPGGLMCQFLQDFGKVLLEK